MEHHEEKHHATDNSIIFFIVAIAIVIAIPTFLVASQPQPTPEQSIIEEIHSIEVASDEAFLNAMIPHHEEAVMASRTIASISKDPKVMQFAEKVIDVQTKEIEQMKVWYAEWYGKEYKSSGMYRPMMQELKETAGEEQDQLYIKGMIDHHKGAVDMAEQILAITQREEVRQLAQEIIENQTAEINQLEAWVPSDTSHSETVETH